MSPSETTAEVSLPTPPPSPPEFLHSVEMIGLERIGQRGTPNEIVEDASESPNVTFQYHSNEFSLRRAAFKNLDLLTLNSTANPIKPGLFRRRPKLQAHHSASKLSCDNSIRSPDRFLGKKDGSDAFIHKFRISQDPQKLSELEKIVRNESASCDCFARRRSISSPTPSILVSGGPRTVSAGMRPRDPSVLTLRVGTNSNNTERVVSLGSAWTVGGLAPVSIGVSNGRGGLTGTGTNAPLYRTSFSEAVPKAQEDRERHEGRLAKALDLDLKQRVFDVINPCLYRSQLFLMNSKSTEVEKKTRWTGTEWVKDNSKPILDAPNLRDDFYCSVLAYSPTCHVLAVGLGSILYAWSEAHGVNLLNAGSPNGPWLTSLAFSSTEGCKCILAYARSDGSLNLMSLYDQGNSRFELKQPYPISCLTWRPTPALRPSRNPVFPGVLVKTEDLIVGDEIGSVYYYSIEWPDAWDAVRSSWYGAMTLLFRISIHSQQICGLAWSFNGENFATGGNDNLCCLFQTSKVLEMENEDRKVEEEVFVGADGFRRTRAVAGGGTVRTVLAAEAKHRWTHGAAVKAIAFCPWRDGLVATGGGSNDKCVHFYHTVSGARLATISVAAQVTSLIWSTTQREIAATFGYAQPEHPYRIAVFSWPDCKQVAAIAWEGGHRALYAIPYPGGPIGGQRSGNDAKGASQSAGQGCIVIAASDESVKFHEVWTPGRRATFGSQGLLGGSEILEGLEGIDKEGEIIR